MTAVLQPLVAKELRALLPAWGACAAALVLASVPDPKLYIVALLVYVIGAIALGALSIGHEYTGGTLGLLLSQPIDRRRLLLVKAGAVALMLVALAGVAWASLFNARAFHLGFLDPEGVGPPQHMAALLVLPALAGLCIAPVLTMICRSPMAGGVFTGTVMGAIWLVAEGLVLFAHGQLRTEGSSLDVLRLPLVWFATIGLSALAALVGWRRFARLEAIEGRGQDLHLPRWRAAPARPAPPHAGTGARRPLWRLVVKELHLQQMTLVVAALYVLAWVAISAVRPMMPEDVARGLDALVFLYAPLVALLAGSLASAEERQFGTLEWQVLLPIAAWRQWVVKAGTAVALAFLLALGLPVLLETIRPSGIDMTGGVGSVGSLLLVLVSVGLYVSTLSTSGIRAMLLSIPVTLLLVVAVGVWTTALFALPWKSLGAAVDWLPLHSAASRTQFARFWMKVVAQWQSLVLAGIFAALALRFALANHRSSERRLGRVWKHALVTGAAVCLVSLLFFWYAEMARTLMYRDFRARRAAETAAAPARPPGAPASGPDRPFAGGSRPPPRQ